MPIRKAPLVTGEYYHIYNRGINRRRTFTAENNYRDYNRAIQTLVYYRPTTNKLRYSHFLARPKDEQKDILTKLAESPHRVTIIAYCLMPNHFHLLLKQEEDGGISQYLADFQNSYTKYFDSKHKRSGALFDRQFKAVLMESENQLLHLTRYIHLNPYSSNLVTNDQIASYPYSSLPEYLSGNYHLANPGVVLDINPRRYESFVLDNADYQQQLERLKHVSLDLEV
ncbi:MAG: transposase [bacterium]